MVESTLKIRQISTERNLMMIKIVKLVMMLKTRKVHKDIFFCVCIKIFLEESLTSEEIETNGGWGIVNEQTMLVKSKSHFQRLSVLYYFKNYDFCTFVGSE